MSTALNTFRILVRLSGLILIILGVIFWTGHALGLIPVHMVVGLILAISLWALAFLGARSGVGAGMVTLVALWALVMLVFGAVQARIMPGAAHWVIQVLHLLIGIGAIGLGDRLGSKMSRAAYQAR
ncbi:MAG TPA: hypothetical protein VJO52_15775 [Gemmatimonadaceae bacterium]|nr:hypothetical protein [Gemmatimonadaceae bacterium]